MKVTSTIKINHSRIKQVTRGAQIALEKTGEALHTEVVQAQVMPFDTGAMQNEKTFVDYDRSKSGEVSIITEGPYARRMYYHPEYNFQTKENPNAKGMFYDDWLPGGQAQDFCHDTFQQFFKKEGGIT